MMWSRECHTVGKHVPLYTLCIQGPASMLSFAHAESCGWCTNLILAVQRLRVVIQLMVLHIYYQASEINELCICISNNISMHGY